MVRFRKNLIFAYSAIPLFRVLLTPIQAAIYQVKIILMLTFHKVVNLVQLLLTKPQLDTLSSTLTLALIRMATKLESEARVSYSNS